MPDIAAHCLNVRKPHEGRDDPWYAHMTARYNFCTLFDSNYAARGLSLYRSLEEYCKGDFQLTILCMDEKVHKALTRLRLPKARLWRVEDIGDAELLAVRRTRPMREFCWTCPGPLMLALLKEEGPGSVVAYLDADLFFFSDIKPVYDELGAKDILIHGHNFAPEHASFAKTSGLFNVGLIAVRNSPEGLACLGRWRAQNIEMCVLDLEKGYCGDQKYLDEWPDLYPNLVVVRHPGIGVAPWNVGAHEVGEREGRLTIDGQPLIFYHFHALKILTGWRRAAWAVRPARGYEFSENVLRLIYTPYIVALRKSQKALPNYIKTPKENGVRQVIYMLRHEQTLIA